MSNLVLTLHVVYPAGWRHPCPCAGIPPVTKVMVVNSGKEREKKEEGMKERRGKGTEKESKSQNTYAQRGTSFEVV